MGGRLDSTNIIRPLVSLITNIGYDHQQFLGNTLPEIAAEKAGIMKAHTPVVISETNEEISRVFQERGRLVSSDLIWAEAEWDVLDLGITAGLRETEVQDKKSGQKTKHLLSLLGDYQLKNIQGNSVVPQNTEGQWICHYRRTHPPGFEKSSNQYRTDGPLADFAEESYGCLRYWPQRRRYPDGDTAAG
jgi:dihydrofolate synthase/folylpolyglutamate synthase